MYTYTGSSPTRFFLKGEIMYGCVPHDALYWYELELDREAEAQDNGFDSWEEYQASIQDDIGNMQYGDWKCER